MLSFSGMTDRCTALTMLIYQPLCSKHVGATRGRITSKQLVQWKGLLAHSCLQLPHCNPRQCAASGWSSLNRLAPSAHAQEEGWRSRGARGAARRNSHQPVPSMSSVSFAVATVALGMKKDRAASHRWRAVDLTAGRVVSPHSCWAVFHQWTRVLRSHTRVSWWQIRVKRNEIAAKQMFCGPLGIHFRKSPSGTEVLEKQTRGVGVGNPGTLLEKSSIRDRGSNKQNWGNPLQEEP